MPQSEWYDGFNFYVANWKTRNLKVMLVDRNDGSGMWDVFRDPKDWAEGVCVLRDS